MFAVPIKRLRLICPCCELRVDREDLRRRVGGRYDGHRVCSTCHVSLDAQEFPVSPTA